MRYLEHRIPPPLVGLVVAGGMWGVAHVATMRPLPRRVRVVAAVAVAVLGIAIALRGIASFRRAQTTVNPLKPETSAALVSSGIYSVTRNPMYLGMLLVLIGWAVYLGSLWPLLGPVVFALFITRFQIVPEERALERLFGAPFVAYKQRVRRWI